MAEHSDVLVIGGGVIGVCTAYSLVKRNVRVRLVERGQICSGCSHGNAGWLFPSHSTPLPAPGAIRQSISWLLDPASPLYIKPRPSVELARWLWRFRAACGETEMRESYRLRRELSLASLERYAKLSALPGFEFGYKQGGLLLAFRTTKALGDAEAELSMLEELGGRGERLTREELRERVPALSPKLAGGISLPDDAHITPDEFVRGLAREAARLDVAVHTETEVFEIKWRRGQPTRVSTTHGEFTCDDLVLAAGAWTPQLARPLRLRLPVQPAKGYSITLRRPDGFGETPVMLGEAKVAATPLGDRLRFAGTLELGGLDLRVNTRRVRAVDRSAREFLPGLPPAETTEIWRGLRPLTPDDLPIIGRPAGMHGLVLATGHGMKGMSQGPITGELVAQLICGEQPAIDPSPFSPDRFR
jgi:D-amino-acid dehydrogenase